MLEVRKSVTLSGTISVEQVTAEGTNTIPVVYMSASIGDDNSSSVTKSIQNKEAYIAHKAEVKQDISEFENMVEDLIR